METINQTQNETSRTVEENYEAAMSFIDLMAKIFQKEHLFKVMKL